MRLAISPYGLALDDYVALAVEAEAAGFESIWVPDHLVVPAEIRSAFPYGRDGDSGLHPGTEIHDAMVLLSFMAAATSALRLGTYVQVLALRHPFVTAKAAASLQILARGRLVLGVGVGWLSEEYDAMGAPFGERGAATEEQIAIMRALWSREVVTGDGAHYPFAAVGMAPRPGPVPIHVGGHSAPAIRRAARLGDGWLGSPWPTAVFAEHLAATVPAVERALERAGRPRDGFEITAAVVGLPAPELFEGAARAGLDRLIVSPWPGRPQHATLADAVRDLAAVADAARAALGSEVVA